MGQREVVAAAWPVPSWRQDRVVRQSVRKAQGSIRENPRTARDAPWCSRRDPRTERVAPGSSRQDRRTEREAPGNGCGNPQTKHGSGGGVLVVQGFLGNFRRPERWPAIGQLQEKRRSSSTNWRSPRPPVASTRHPCPVSDCVEAKRRVGVPRRASTLTCRRHGGFLLVLIFQQLRTHVLARGLPVRETMTMMLMVSLKWHNSHAQRRIGQDARRTQK